MVADRRRCAAVLAIVGMLAWSQVLGAQEVLGEVHDASRVPIPGALVTLVDTAGVSVGRSLTSDRGRFFLRAPAPGRYRVQAERIGFRTERSEWLVFAADSVVRLDLRVEDRAISLEEISVEATPRCEVRPSDAGRTARLWEEASRALTAAAVAEEERIFRFHLTSFERTVDPTTNRTLREDTEERIVEGEVPTRSASPEALERRGFVWTESDSLIVWLAPDADVLLSDPFLDTHCFRAETRSRRAEEGMVGLSFEPLPGRDLPEIRGTLWLDARSAELRSLEYRYVNLPWRGVEDEVGGTLEFERGPSGGWFVRSAVIRMPTAVRRVRGGFAAAGLKEEGHQVTAVDLEGADRWTVGAERGIRGVVWDSTRSAPLAGALVFVDGTSVQSRTDALGRFSLPDPGSGEYRLRFAHPRADSLGYEPPGVMVGGPAPSREDVRMGIPSSRSLYGSRCGSAREPVEIDTATLAPPAVLFGTVRILPEGDPVTGATVFFRWDGGGVAETSELPERNSGISAGEVSGAIVRVRPDGTFDACGIPAGVDLWVWAERDDLRSRRQSLTLSEFENRRFDLGLLRP